MPRVLKTLLVLVLAALLPLRAVAGVTIGFCANGHQEPQGAAHAAQDNRAARIAQGDRVTQGTHGHHATLGAHRHNAAHTGHDHHLAGAQVAYEGQPAKPATPTCSICAEHCSSAAFAPGVAPQGLAAHAAAQATPRDNARAAPPHFPDQLDRPPLA